MHQTRTSVNNDSNNDTFDDVTIILFTRFCIFMEKFCVREQHRILCTHHVHNFMLTILHKIVDAGKYSDPEEVFIIFSPLGSCVLWSSLLPLMLQLLLLYHNGLHHFIKGLTLTLHRAVSNNLFAAPSASAVRPLVPARYLLRQPDVTACQSPSQGQPIIGSSKKACNRPCRLTTSNVDTWGGRPSSSSTDSSESNSVL